MISMRGSLIDTNYNDKEAILLREASLNGSSKALGDLVEMHRDFIYNVVLKMVLNPEIAKDITQDVIIKIITNIAGFKGNSTLRTWIYRIAFNHVLSVKRQPSEQNVNNFEDHGASWDALPDNILQVENQAEANLIVEEAKLGCTTAMLLCLDRQQRLIFILGDIFAINSTLGAEVLEITPDNYRQQLARARKQLYNFMDKKCGLINKSNPCRCHKKAQTFINNGWVNPDKMIFNAEHKKRINEFTREALPFIDDMLEAQYAEIYADSPFLEPTDMKKRIKNIIQSDEVKELYKLN